MDVSRPARRVAPRRRSIKAAAAIALAFLGCTGEESVVVETVPKDTAPAALPATKTSDRLLGAIVPHGETAWFFKMTGPEAAVAKQKAPFLDLLRSVRFEQDRPVWTAPAGWSETDGNAMRLATLKLPGDPPLEVAISSLSFQPGGPEEFVLANVNRWRGQMGLAPIEASTLHAGGTLDDETQQLSLTDGTQATLVSFKGSFEGGMSAPFAGGMPLPPATPTARETDDDAPVRFTLPTGWESLGAEGISVATFAAADGAVKITTTPLAASNELLPNLVRWRDQVGLPPLKDGETEAALNAVETITLGDGEEARYVTLTSPDGVRPAKTFLVVFAVRDETAWFVKLAGPPEAALREKANFEAFVKSLRFSGG